MKCPHCSTELRVAERQGVEIDYCPSCRGVWLDRGEIDKLIERSHAFMSATLPVQTPLSRETVNVQQRRHFDDDDDDQRERRNSDDFDRRPKKRRDGFLDNIFDIFD